jgi:DHA2 family methylenomycin A resistance protein-like MFS transporter
MAFFVVQLDATIVTVALAAVGRDLGGPTGDQQWVVASYTVALAAGMLTAGSVGDRYGSRRICVFGLITFALASAACCFAPSMGVLIAARTVQGIGAAALLPCSLALIVQQFPGPRERAHALGMWGGIAGIGLSAGPVVGGALVAAAGWRAIFLVNVPFCLLTVLLTCAWVAEAPRHREAKLDPAGLVLGTVALASLTGGLIEAGNLGWTSPIPLVLMAGGLVAGAVFVALEHRHPAPMLPLRIFGSRTFSAGTATGLLFNFCLYGTLVCLSLFLQGPLGQPASRTGLLILPMTVTIGFGAFLSGRLTARFGSRIPMVAGFAFAALGAAVLLVAGRSGPLPVVVAGSMLLGFCSIAMPAMTSVTLSGVAASRSGLGSGVLNTARQSGGALGTAVLGTLLTADGGMEMRTPMVVVVLGYAAAIGCTVVATHRSPSAVSG